jgi:hypothetical protein
VDQSASRIFKPRLDLAMAWLITRTAAGTDPRLLFLGIFLRAKLIFRISLTNRGLILRVMEA